MAFKDYEDRIGFLKSISPYHFDRFAKEAPPFAILGRFVGADWSKELAKLDAVAQNFGFREMSSNSKKRGYLNAQFDHSVTGDGFYPPNQICFRTTPEDAISPEKTPVLWKIVRWFGMEPSSCLPRIHIQDPGQVFPFHVDGLTKNRDTKDLNERMQERPGDFARIQVQLQDWVWGHVWACGNHYWTQWRAGEIMYHPWWIVPHGTANCSFAPRYSLQITGQVTDVTLQRLASRDLTIDLQQL